MEKYAFILAFVKFYRQIACFLCLITAITTNGQNAVFSDPAAMAVFRNPAQTGNFLGSIRLSGAYRNQWNSVNNGVYTASMSVDGPLSIAADHDWIGIGAHVVRDEVGSVNLRNIELGANLAYHKSLDAYNEHVLSAGLGVGYGERSLVTIGNAVFLDELEEVVSVSPDRASFIFAKRSFLELSIGMQLNSRLSDRLQVAVDLTSRHLNRPDISLDELSEFKSNLFYRAQIGFHINPEASVQFLLDYQFLMVKNVQQHRGGVVLRKLLGFNNNRHVDIGGGLHGSASFYALIGGQLDNNFIRLVYDRTQFYFNTGQEHAIELSGYHVFRLRHKPKIKPTIFCPRF